MPINHWQRLWHINQDSDQSFSRLWHIKTPINCSQDLGISRLINHLQDLGISKHMPTMSWICQSCQWLIRALWMINLNTVMPKSCKWLIGVRICPNLVNDWSKSGYAQILQTTDQSLVMPKSCKWLIGVWICQCLANDWLESGYAKVLKMIEQLESGLCRIWKTWNYPEAKRTKVWLEQRFCLNFSLSQVLWCLLSVIALCEEKKLLETIKNNLKAG